MGNSPATTPVRKGKEENKTNGDTNHTDISLNISNIDTNKKGKSKFFRPKSARSTTKDEKELKKLKEKEDKKKRKKKNVKRNKEQIKKKLKE